MNNQYKESQNGAGVNMQNDQNNGQQTIKNHGENMSNFNQNPYQNRPMDTLQQSQQAFTKNQQQNSQNPYINAQGLHQNPYANRQISDMQQPQMQQNPYINTQMNTQTHDTFTSKVAHNVNHIFDNKFLLGVAVGGVATYLLTNDDAQKAIIKTGMKLFSKVAGSIEEIKEKIMDAQAEIEQEKENEKSL